MAIFLLNCAVNRALHRFFFKSDPSKPRNPGEMRDDYLVEDLIAHIFRVCLNKDEESMSKKEFLLMKGVSITGGFVTAPFLSAIYVIENIITLFDNSVQKEGEKIEAQAQKIKEALQIMGPYDEATHRIFILAYKLSQESCPFVLKSEKVTLRSALYLEHIDTILQHSAFNPSPTNVVILVTTVDKIMQRVNENIREKLVQFIYQETCLERLIAIREEQTKKVENLDIKAEQIMQAAKMIPSTAPSLVSPTVNPNHSLINGEKNG